MADDLFDTMISSGNRLASLRKNELDRLDTLLARACAQSEPEVYTANRSGGVEVGAADENWLEMDGNFRLLEGNELDQIANFMNEFTYPTGPGFEFGTEHLVET